MALKEIPLNEGNQLTFKAFELAELVANLLRTKAAKAEANEEFNLQIKALEKHIYKLSAEIESEKHESALHENRRT